jgi:hypothetical protein
MERFLRLLRLLLRLLRFGLRLDFKRSGRRDQFTPFINSLQFQLDFLPERLAFASIAQHFLAWLLDLNGILLSDNKKFKILIVSKDDILCYSSCIRFS